MDDGDGSYIGSYCIPFKLIAYYMLYTNFLGIEYASVVVSYSCHLSGLLWLQHEKYFFGTVDGLFAAAFAFVSSCVRFDVPCLFTTSEAEPGVVETGILAFARFHNAFG